MSADVTTRSCPEAGATRAPDGAGDVLSRALDAGRRRRRRLTVSRRALLHVVLIAILLAWVYPFLWMVSASLKTPAEVFGSGLDLIPAAPSLDNYVRAWEQANFATYFVNTVVVTVAVVLLVILVSSLAGYALGRGSMPGKKVVLGALVATMFLPKGVSLIPVFLIVHNLGLSGSLAGIILGEAGPAHVVAILLFMGFFASIPNDIEEAATLDGAGHPRIYAQIMLPLAKPVIGTVAIFNFISAWNAFLLPLVFTLTTPHLRTLGVGIYTFFGEFNTDWTGLAAAAVITILPIIAVFLWLQRLFIEGIAGAVKS